MTEDDRTHWDERYAQVGAAPHDRIALPPVFAPYVERFPTAGDALELACGRGPLAVWLALRGMSVWGVDISAVAIDMARTLAIECGVDERCRFDVVDLDLGVPAGPPVDLIMCHRFRDARLDGPIVERLVPGGLLAMVVLSEVDAGPGPFRARPGALVDAFGALEVVAAGEGDGEAWLLATATA